VEAGVDAADAVESSERRMKHGVAREQVVFHVVQPELLGHCSWKGDPRHGVAGLEGRHVLVLGVAVDDLGGASDDAVRGVDRRDREDRARATRAS
jgi:hypothetical protein